MNRQVSPRYNELAYSVRRYYVDEFYSRHIAGLQKTSLILDIGGHKGKKRGFFNIDEYGFNVKYLNIDPAANPDYLCDAASVPVAAGTFDCVICSEVLEHLPNPREAVTEMFRVLKPGGTVLICSPFLFHIHADPYDFGRYTDYWFKDILNKAGFSEITIEKQGLFFSVLAQMIKLWAYEASKKGSLAFVLFKPVIIPIVGLIVKKALQKDKTPGRPHVFESFTTGFGIVAVK